MMKISPASAYLTFFFATFILIGCTDLPDPPRDGTPAPTPYPFSCDMFMEGRWLQLRFGADAPDDFVETVEKVWGAEVGTIEFVRAVTAGKEAIRGMWTADSSVLPGQSYRVRFDREEKLSYVGVYWDREDVSQPTLVQVLDCLGVPDYYVAALVEDRKDWLNFSLWYVEKGFVIPGSSFRQVSFGPRGWPSIESNTLMGSYAHRHQGDLNVVAAGNLKRMVSDVYGTGLLAWELCLIRPWPGTIDALEILPFEEYLRCAT